VTPETNSDERMNLYILGELSEQEQEEVEKEYFEDADYFARLISAEDALIGRYLRGELTESEQAQFGKAFLTDPRRRRRVETYRALVDPALSSKWLASDDADRTRTTWREALSAFLRGDRKLLMATVALVVLAILAGLWLLYLRPGVGSPAEPVVNRVKPSENKPDQPPQLARESPVNSSQANTSGVDSPTPDPVPRPSPEERQRPPETKRRKPPEEASFVATFTLLPGALRRLEGAQSLEVPQGARLLRLELGLVENNFSAYRVVLRHMGRGVELRQWRGLKVRSGGAGTVLAVNLPAGQLADGVHELTVYGVAAGGGEQGEEVESYQFRIIKNPSSRTPANRPSN
jgi:hypothetical protein